MRPPPSTAVADRRIDPERFRNLAGVFLLAALLFGMAAALLAASPPAPARFVSSPGFFLTYGDLEILSAIVVGGFAAWFVYRVILRLRDPAGSDYFRRPAVVFLVALLICVAFIGIVRALPPHGESTGGGRNNTTGPTNMTTPPPGGLPPSVSIGSTSVPGWGIYVAVLAGVALVAVVAVPIWLASRARGEVDVPGRSRAALVRQAREEIAATLARLESDPNADPRALIEALYAKLLGTLEPKVEHLGPKTAREVEALAVAQLSLPRAAARELTDVFEEARYSTHPVTRNDADRARSALGRILAALDAGGARA